MGIESGRVARWFCEATVVNGADRPITAAAPSGGWPGAGDFSVALWLRSDGDVVGDLVSRFDADARRGFSLAVATSSGVTSTAQPNYRHLQFGIDNGTTPRWVDRGRPGRAAFVTALCACGGSLHAGTCELGAQERGHLWRYGGAQQWDDMGSPPEGCNSVPTVVAFDGALHCGSGRYNPQGSCLGDARNNTPGGRVYRVEAGGEWIDCGHPGGEGARGEDQAPATGHSETGRADEAMSLTVFRGNLYVTSCHRRGAFRYEGDRSWKPIGLDHRLMTFTIYRDRLYALVNGGGVYRYEDGSDWTFCGNPVGSRQTYSAAVLRGELLVGTWPEGDVQRYEGGDAWSTIGRAGYEREVMAMLLYNGKLYAGTLPMANVWRLDGEAFTFMRNLDNTPTYLRRVWSMGIHDGRLYCGTLPSGRVWSLEAGRMATHEHALPSGWHHVAAVRRERRLELYLDGRHVAGSMEFDPGDYDLGTDAPLDIGSGPGHPFRGNMRDVCLYDCALAPREIRQLVGEAPS